MTAPAERRHVPYAADLARCLLLVERSGVAEQIDAQIRTSSRGRKRGTTAAGMLTACALSLRVYEKARGKKLEELKGKLLPPEALQLLNFLSADGSPIRASQVSYWFKILHEGYASDPLRPCSAALTSQDRLDRQRLLWDMLDQLIGGWCPGPLLNGDLIVFDATILEAAARPLSSKVREKLLLEHSTDLLLQEERKFPEDQQRRIKKLRQHRAVEARWGHATTTNAQAKSIVGGYAFHTVALKHSNPDAAEPALLVTCAFTAASGYSSPEVLRSQLQRYVQRVGQDFIIVADRDYSKSLAVWAWLREHRYGFIFDLREEQLQPRGTFGGAILAQGNALCPATPAELRNPGPRPTSTVDGKPSPAKLKWDDKIGKQLPYRAHVRSYRDNGINVSCPALGPYASVQCALRGQLDPTSNLPIVHDPPLDGAQEICTQATLLIPDSENPLRQTRPWGRPDHDRLYGQGRSSIEGEHGVLKHPDGRNLSRWVTGSSYPEVVALLGALDMALANLDAIRKFLDVHPDHPSATDLREDLLFAPDDALADWLDDHLEHRTDVRP